MSDASVISAGTECSRALPFGAPYRAATYVLASICLCVGVAGLFVSPAVTLLAGALLCGWCELDGLCGSSHVASFAAIRNLEGDRGWLRALLAYTLGGTLTAALVGSMFGALALTMPSNPTLLVTITAVLALILAARELRLISFDLPQVHRQTDKMWAPKFGFTTAAGMWGSHIGLAIATVIMHGGLFVILAATLLLGPLFGIALLCVFWLGRTLPMWYGRLLPRGVGEETAPAELDMEEAAYRHAATVGMLLLAAGVVQMGLF